MEREFINTIAYGVSCGVEFNSMAGLEATIFKDLMKDSFESFYIF